MKKILFYISGIYNGGTEVALYNLVSNLDNKKYKLYINYEEHDNIFYPLASKILKHVEYLDIENKIEVDTLIYCNRPHESAKKIRDNVECKNSYFWFHYFSEGQEKFVKESAKNNSIDKVITVCETIKNTLLEWDCFENKKDMVISNHNILNSNEIKNKSQEVIKMNLSNNINFVTVARFDIVKGYHRVKALIDCFEQKNIDFKLFIIGNGRTEEDEERVRNMFKNNSNVEFLGYQENPFKYVKQCDYHVLLSDKENMSLALLESKILGIPSIVTDFESAFEQIEDMKNGIILSRENIDSYRERVDDIINNAEIFKNNLKNFEYNIGDILKKWDKLLNK